MTYTNADKLLADMPPLDQDATDVESLVLLLTVIHHARPATIVEAGTYLGHFAVAAARLMPESQIWTADKIRPDLPDLPNLHFVEGDFEHDLLRPNFTSDTIGFAYIDSGSRRDNLNYESAVRRRHWLAARPYICPGGMMAIHDINTTDWHGGLDTIAECAFRSHGGSGVGFWQAR